MDFEYIVYDFDQSEMEVCPTLSDAMNEARKMYKKAFREDPELKVETLKDIKIFKVCAVTEIVDNLPIVKTVF